MSASTAQAFLSAAASGTLVLAGIVFSIASGAGSLQVVRRLRSALNAIADAVVDETAVRSFGSIFGILMRWLATHRSMSRIGSWRSRKIGSASASRASLRDHVEGR
jgi:hypothetical protein